MAEKFSASSITYTLSDGGIIPAVGLGTYTAENKDEVTQAVKTALKVGYRLIDTARAYGTEAAIGKGLKESGIPRKEIFITTKVWNDHFSKEGVFESVEGSLKDLQTDYIDLLLLHWPVAGKLDSHENFTKLDIQLSEPWSAFEELVKQGKVKHIGVSNFTRKYYQEILKSAKIKPVLNQIEFHPYFNHPSFVEYSKSLGILVQAYTPLGNQVVPGTENFPRVLNDPELLKLSEKYKVPVSTIVLSWDIALGVSTVPKSVTPSRIEQNLQLIKLDSEDIELITSLNKKNIKYVDTSKFAGEHLIYE